MSVRDEIVARSKMLPNLSVPEIVAKAERLSELASDKGSAVMAGAWWRRLSEKVNDTRSQSLAAMKMREMENWAICYDVREQVEASGGSFSPELMAMGNR
jgi:hypothetical protein